MIRSILRNGAALAVAAALLSPLAASAQSQLDTSEASGFLGRWTISLQTEMGPFEMGLNLTDASGKVAAQMTSEIGNVDITNITRSGEALVLSYSMDAQGQAIPVSMNLRQDGETLRAAMEFAGGAFTANGTGRRAD